MNKLPFFIQTPWVGAIGNMSEEIYYGLLRARRENRKVIFFFPYDLFKPFVFSKNGLGVNSELKKIESVYRLGKYNNPLIILLNILLTLFCCVLIVLDMTIGKLVTLPRWFRVPHIGSELLWKRKRGEKYSSKKVEKWNWEGEFSSFLEISLSSKSIVKAEEIRKKIGLPENCWYVCLHVRESGYYGRVKGYKEGHGKTSRNSNIQNYFKAVKLITDRGGWVVRMGDNGMTPIPKMKNVIDYPFTKYKSDLMDIYFLKKCSFFLGPHSGIADTAIMFQKPVVFPDGVTTIFINPRLFGSLTIFKYVYDKEEKKFLTLKEMLYGLYKEKNLLNQKKYLLVENDENDIFDVVNEFLEIRKTHKYSNSQKEWVKKSKELGSNFMNIVEFNDIKKHRDASNVFGSIGTVGSKYYSKYYDNRKYLAY